MKRANCHPNFQVDNLVLHVDFDLRDLVLVFCFQRMLIKIFFQEFEISNVTPPAASKLSSSGDASAAGIAEGAQFCTQQGGQRGRTGAKGGVDVAAGPDDVEVGVLQLAQQHPDASACRHRQALPVHPQQVRQLRSAARAHSVEFQRASCQRSRSRQLWPKRRLNTTGEVHAAEQALVAPCSDQQCSSGLRRNV